LLTTTDRDPESIHQLGLAEVKRIEGEQLAIARSLGFGDLMSFRVSQDQSEIDSGGASATRRPDTRVTSWIAAQKSGSAAAGQ
jgi:uncharacterized protein (DUF885 family)